jgi:hypothetical protein
MYIEPLAAYAQHPVIKRKFPTVIAILCFSVCEHQSLVLADFRQLAAKKALSSSKNSLSSFRRRISVSCFFTCLRKFASFSARRMAVCRVCAP